MQSLDEDSAFELETLITRNMLEFVGAKRSERTFIPTNTGARKELYVMSGQSDTNSDGEIIMTLPSNAPKRSACARKIVPSITNADANRKNVNQCVEKQFDNMIATSTATVKALQHQLFPTQQNIGFIESQPPQQAQTVQILHSQQQQRPKMIQMQSRQHQQPQMNKIKPGQLFLRNDDDTNPNKISQTQVQEQNPSASVDPLTEPSTDVKLYDVLIAILDGNAKLRKQMDHLINLQEKMLSTLLSFGKPASNENSVANNIAPTLQLNTTEFSLIDTLEDIQDFENKLSNGEFYEAMISKFQTVCGPTCNFSGEHVSYKLIDSIFTRRFFTLVCWTGSVRTTSKGRFGEFIKTIAFFYQLVRKCDQTYTEMQVKAFFRKMMDNSTRTTMIKHEYASDDYDNDGEHIH